MKLLSMQITILQQIMIMTNEWLIANWLINKCALSACSSTSLFYWFGFIIIIRVAVGKLPSILTFHVEGDGYLTLKICSWFTLRLTMDNRLIKLAIKYLISNASRFQANPSTQISLGWNFKCENEMIILIEVTKHVSME